jgi:outer membrane lipoprotein-sorting protein
MKKLFTLSLAALMLVASVAFVTQPAQAQGPGLVSSILNKMDRNRRSLTSLRAGLTMQKYNAQLGDYDMAYGEVAYISGKGTSGDVKVEWRKPAQEFLSVLGGQYVLYRPRLNQALVGNAKSAKGNAKISGVLGFSMSMTGAQAKNQFDVEFVGEGSLDGPHVWQLKLTPRGAASYKFAEVWVNDDGMPIQTRVTEKNGDSTLVRLTNIQRNASVPSGAFNIDLPAGTKIVKG